MYSNMKSTKMCLNRSRFDPSFVGLEPLFHSAVMLDVRIIAHTSLSVPKELLVDPLERGVLLFSGLLDSILMVLMVLILG